MKFLILKCLSEDGELKDYVRCCKYLGMWLSDDH